MRKVLGKFIKLDVIKASKKFPIGDEVLTHAKFVNFDKREFRDASLEKYLLTK